jgi:hypothetical protein
VLPPSWTIMTCALIYLVMESLYLLLYRLLVEVGKEQSILIPRDTAVITSVILFAVYRVLAFHPLANPDYTRWLYLTPWRPGQRLPLGPVHLTVQDIVLVGLGVLFCHSSPRGQFGVPLAFAMTYLSCLCLICWYSGVRWWTYLIVFGLGLSVRLSDWSMVAALIAAVATYPLALAAMRVSLAHFPWTPDRLNRIATHLSMKSRQQMQTFYDRTQLGWPYDLLHRHVQVVPREWPHLIAQTLLVAWCSYAPLSLLSAEVGDVFSWSLPGIALLLAALRPMIYGSHCRPPISLLGRLLTLRWIIPGYDQVFLAPLCVVVAGSAVPLALEYLQIPPSVNVGLSLSLALLALCAVGPSFEEWLLTGRHRLVPGITNRNKFEEI